MSESRVKRVISKTWTGILANITDPAQTPQNTIMRFSCRKNTVFPVVSQRNYIEYVCEHRRKRSACVSDLGIDDNLHDITKTYLYDFDPLKPTFI